MNDQWRFHRVLATVSGSLGHMEDRRVCVFTDTINGNSDVSLATFNQSCTPQWGWIDRRLEESTACETHHVRGSSGQNESEQQSALGRIKARRSRHVYCLRDELLPSILFSSDSGPDRRDRFRLGWRRFAAFVLLGAPSLAFRMFCSTSDAAWVSICRAATHFHFPNRKKALARFTWSVECRMCFGTPARRSSLFLIYFWWNLVRPIPIRDCQCH